MPVKSIRARTDFQPFLSTKLVHKMSNLKQVKRHEMSGTGRCIRNKPKKGYLSHGFMWPITYWNLRFLW